MQYVIGTMVVRMCQKLLKFIGIGQDKAADPIPMRVEIISHDRYFYWLVEFDRKHAIEGYSESIQGALKEISDVCAEEEVH